MIQNLTMTILKEELRLQKERAKELKDLVEKLRREEQEKLKSKHP